MELHSSIMVVFNFTQGTESGGFKLQKLGFLTLTVQNDACAKSALKLVTFETISWHHIMHFTHVILQMDFK